MKSNFGFDGQFHNHREDKLKTFLQTGNEAL
jgi:hypothetical protein